MVVTMSEISDTTLTRINEACVAYAAYIAQFNNGTQANLTNVIYSDNLFLGQSLEYYFERISNPQLFQKSVNFDFWV